MLKIKVTAMKSRTSTTSTIYIEDTSGMHISCGLTDSDLKLLGNWLIDLASVEEYFNVELSI